ncbi:MAG TPA: IPT/TIG domain-containing protein [Bryobacteraceae bacterium]|jgi:uncharacterized protein (TIGR03437 family)|nr:IPT/TIG domain-containing protein [Bryobacteraceae bacterium]
MLRNHRFFLLTAVAAALTSPVFSQTPVINKGGIVNGATFSGSEPVAPGALISIFGTDLASKPAPADTVPLSTKLGNVSVSINGVAAPLLYVSALQINAQVPWEAITEGTTKTVNVVVTTNGTPSQPQTVVVGPYSPGVFQYLNHALVIIATDPTDPRYGLIAAPPGTIPHLTTARAKANDVCLFYATGLGAVTPAAVTGAGSADHLRKVNVLPIVQVGGAHSRVEFAGLSPQFPGVYQVNIVIPGIPPSDTAPVQIIQGGITTPADVTMAVGE